MFLTFVHNCPSNQETATGAIIYALPKWAVYKGATYFWCPVWTAWEIFDAVGQKNNDDLYPGAFVQMQPVLPQREADVQAEVTYFVGDVSSTQGSRLGRGRAGSVFCLGGVEEGGSEAEFELTTWLAMSAACYHGNVNIMVAQACTIIRMP